MQNTIKQYFTGSFIVTLVGLTLAFFLGSWEAVWITFVLGVLEVSLSFDNAIVNAQVLKDMDQKWRKRFLTWGMLIAVGFMRLLFPLLIVAIAIHSTPWAALQLAIHDHTGYKDALTSVHISVMGFGQAFLMMVALKFFIDNDKDLHWLGFVEDKLTVLGKIEAIQAAITLAISYGLSLAISEYSSPYAASDYLHSSIIGLILYILVDGIGAFLEVDENEDGVNDLAVSVAKTGLAGFLYLEVLDASFSFDGVLGAFALSDNMFIIAIGLGIGAMFVRSLTILMVDKGTVEQFIYLEHGAFYAIFALAIIMNINTITEISETVTGLIGATFIGLSIISSINHARHSS